MTDPTPGTRPGQVKSATRALEVLELLGVAREPATFAGIGAELRIPKSSLHSLLRTMTARGWLEVDSTGTRYRLGLRALLTGVAYIDMDDIVQLAQDVLDELAARTGEAVHLGRLDGAEVVYLAKRESAHPLRMFSAVGRRLPTHATALGKAILAQLPVTELADHLAVPLAALTPSTITDPAVLRRELDSVRRAGFAEDAEENSLEILCFAVALAPVRRSWNALSCSVPKSRLTPELRTVIVEGLTEAKQAIDARAAHLRQ